MYHKVLNSSPVDEMMKSNLQQRRQRGIHPILYVTERDNNNKRGKTVVQEKRIISVIGAQS